MYVGLVKASDGELKEYNDVETVTVDSDPSGGRITIEFLNDNPKVEFNTDEWSVQSTHTD